MTTAYQYKRALLWFAAFVALFTACASSVLAQGTHVYILKYSDWNVPRTTRTILTMPALRKTIKDYNAHPRATIQIHYPGGDEGTLWASELRGWLVSLGVSSQHIELLPGTRRPGQLELQVVRSSDLDS